MKKIVLVFIIMLFAAAGCNSTGEVNIAESNIPYIYFEGHRLNCETGVVTFLCSDPLCAHDSSACPFYGFDMLTPVITAQNKVFFYRHIPAGVNISKGEIDSSYTPYELVCYDISTQRVRIIFSYEPIGGISSDVMIEEDGIIYIQMTNLEDQDNSLDKTNPQIKFLKSEIYAIDEESGKAEKIMEFSGCEQPYPTFSMVKDGRFYFNQGDEYYSVDKDGGDRENVNIYDTGKFIAEDGNLYYYKNKNIYKAEPGNIDPVILAKNTSPYKFYHNGYIYFFHTGSGYSVAINNEVKNSTGGKIYRISATDPNSAEELFYDCGELANLAVFTTQFAGKYMAVVLQEYIRGDNGFITAKDCRTILLLDTETGAGQMIDY